MSFADPPRQPVGEADRVAKGDAFGGALPHAKPDALS